MSTLDSSSTWAEILAAYDDNGSYEEDNDVSKARAFVTACRLMLRQFPKRTAHGGSGRDTTEMEMDPRLIREELQQAQQWLSQNQNGSGPPRYRSLSFANFRGSG